MAKNKHIKVGGEVGGEVEDTAEVVETTEDVTEGTEADEESRLGVTSEEGQDGVVEEVKEEAAEEEVVAENEASAAPDVVAAAGDEPEEDVTTVVTDEANEPHEPKVGSQDSTLDLETHFAAWNDKGHRIAMMNDRGNITVTDDDTALILYENPAFYVELYDSDRMKHIPTRMFTWVDNKKQSTGLVVGQPYELVKG